MKWVYMRNTLARDRAAEFPCQFPAAAPKFRCRQAGQIVFKNLIYNVLLTLRGCLSGAEDRFFPVLREMTGRDHQRTGELSLGGRRYHISASAQYRRVPYA